MIFTTLTNTAKLPPKVSRLEAEYMCPSTKGHDFSVNLEALSQVREDDFWERLCSPQIFLSAVWSSVDQTGTGLHLVHKRVIQKQLPFSAAIEAGLKPVSCEVLAALVWGIDLTKRNPDYPLAKARNANNHVLYPLGSKSSPGVCTVTPLQSGKVSFTSPLNPRPTSFPPGSVLLFTT
jgi:hypothetical protein